jgi:hypothetical protein
MSLHDVLSNMVNNVCISMLWRVTIHTNNLLLYQDDDKHFNDLKLDHNLGHA